MTTVSRTALAVALAFSVPVAAQEQGEYRDFQLGASVAAISTLTRTRTTDITVVHERPAAMQELRWIPSTFGVAGPLKSRGEGLQQVVFSFYENQL